MLSFESGINTCTTVVYFYVCACASEPRGLLGANLFLQTELEHANVFHPRTSPMVTQLAWRCSESSFFLSAFDSLMGDL